VSKVVENKLHTEFLNIANCLLQMNCSVETAILLIDSSILIRGKAPEKDFQQFSLNLQNYVAISSNSLNEIYTLMLQNPSE